MTPEQAKTISEFLLTNFEREIPTTCNVFRAVPGERADYRPDPVSKTALGLVRHITLEDEWMLNAVADGAFGPWPDDSDACGITTPADAVARYQERIGAGLARVRGTAGEALLKDVDLGGQFRLTAIEWLSLALRHSAHHRGQLSAYLRAMGSKVPAIYGPSADTMTAAVAAEQQA